MSAYEGSKMQEYDEARKQQVAHKSKRENLIAETNINHPESLKSKPFMRGECRIKYCINWRNCTDGDGCCAILK